MNTNLLLLCPPFFEISIFYLPIMEAADKIIYLIIRKKNENGQEKFAGMAKPGGIGSPLSSLREFGNQLDACLPKFDRVFGPGKRTITKTTS